MSDRQGCGHGRGPGGGHGRGGHGRGPGGGHGAGHGGGHGRGPGGGHGGGHRRGGHSGGWGTPLEPALLAALADGPRHGYDLRTAVEEMTESLVSADPGSLYRLLRRLEDDGMVTSDWADGTHGPQRRQYQLTPEGRETLAQWHHHLQQRITGLRTIIDAIAVTLNHTPPPQQDSTKTDPKPSA